MTRVPQRLLHRFGDWLMHQAGPNGAYGAGLHYVERGRLDLAAQAFQDAQRLWELELGRQHVYVALAIAKRGWCCVRMGHAREAVELYEIALAIECALRGDASERVRELADELADARRALAEA